MLDEKKRETNIGVGVGLVVQAVGRLAEVQGQSWGFALALVGLVPFVWGCMSYCEGKGYSRWLGFVGLLSILGLLALTLLRDRYKIRFS